MWFVLFLSVAHAKLNKEQFRCHPVRETIVSSAIGVLSHQGPISIYVGWDTDASVTIPIRQIPCLRVGLREHFTWTSAWVEEGANGYEMIFKTQAMLGSYGQLSKKVNLGGYVLAGVKTHHVRQDVDYPERGINERYAGTANIPSFYLYSTLDYFPMQNIGVNLNISVPIYDFERESYWYANRIVGMGIQVKK